VFLFAAEKPAQNLSDGEERTSPRLRELSAHHAGVDGTLLHDDAPVDNEDCSTGGPLRDASHSV
jgi:hypothetical protein